MVTNAKGFTLYWFVPDTATKSNCNGSCAGFWPPVTGPATAGPGVTGKLGVITRSDGSKQAAYDGQGTDWNNEVFPPIRDLRVVLARCGLPMKVKTTL